MTPLEARDPVATKPRAVIHRTRGRTHGPISRLMSPGDLGEALKPFVFLDRIDTLGVDTGRMPNFGLHPHSGIATLTSLFEGSFGYEDTGAWAAEGIARVGPGRGAG